MYWLAYHFPTLLGASTTSAIWAMMVACFLPFFWAMFSKWQGGFQIKDNDNPRAFLAKTTGISARANAIQANSFETLPMFLAGVLLAMYCFVPPMIINQMSWLYILLRICFGACYLINWAVVRSLIWALSMGCIFMLFWASARMVR